jgi:hypothetical protein
MGRDATLGGNSRPATNSVYQTSRPRNLYRESANAAMEPSPTDSAVATTAMSALLPTFSQKEAEVRMVL